jgi:Protein of unknown function (DUF2846)
LFRKSCLSCLTAILLPLCGSLSRAQSDSKTQEVAPPEGKALVYFYREPKSETVVKYTISVFCDGVHLGKLQPSRYFAVALNPGKHVCKSTEESQKPVELDLKADEIKYFEMRTREHMFKFTGYLIPIRAEEGQETIKTLWPSDKRDIRDRKTVIIPKK